ncbi:McrB family protein [Acholeplasma laidlawii]|uniref:McrBC 5-methylcytosine restriction system component n=1 Tax=Acholeplasma laidlawii (strain PG-8A) TaxID=441768 RepID=A9NFW9_ACHLI|nr:AAA family ATPase [Acholeplasma laidlawii]ABX81249.1 McrBC 5-methylcytosine restriction system component [Acholeplasma laidlawii PG-8A]RED20338.1 5-methylcytosine-specific restriction protein B [Acholeplasma laidlawii]SQH56850.1 5-methylcytosine-specific restriction enzyme B [Acholeplasma laidlawii]
MINDINRFIQLADTNNLKTKEIETQITNNNRDIIGNFHVTVSFGVTNVANIPWFSISRFTDYKEDAPVFLYYKKQNKLVLSFGVKEEKNNKDSLKYNFKWNDLIRENYQTVQEYFGERVDRYGDSYVYKTFDVANSVVANGESISTDLTEMLMTYKKQLPCGSLINYIKANYTSYLNKFLGVMDKERVDFLNAFPLNNLLNITLDDYSKNGNKDSFTNYIENKTSNICSGNLGINPNKLFYPKNNGYEVLSTVSSAYETFGSVNLKFDEFKRELHYFITNFNINNYQTLNVLKFRANIIKFNVLRLYRNDVALYGLPSQRELSKILVKIGLNINSDDSIAKSIILTNYLISQDPQIVNLNTDIVNRLIWDYKVDCIDSNVNQEDSSEDSNEEEKISMNKNFDKNLILYGPPGTGKTYNTKIYAVAICDDLDLDEVKNRNYDDVLKRYDELVLENRVKFTTFHQSYGYEDFIEGLYPEIKNGSDQITYRVKAGVFKAFCANESFDSLWDSFVLDVKNGKVKWGDILPNADEHKKDTVLSVNGNGNIDLPYANGVPFTRENAKKIYLGQEVDNTQKDYFEKVFNYFKKNYMNKQNKGNKKVFIIDEINRGNISKIFGELITLIEDTKRKGEKEEMSITLPYSKKPFTVPNNVHILGTMNTADRSIALMDTALRRRFAFEEMMPEPELIKAEVDGLKISEMLTAINKRIEVLYDREHTIGHAFFMDKKLELGDLAHIFKNKIIPLLQEYFYEDYEKIQWVLGDNEKTDESFKFIKQIKNEANIFKGKNGADMNALPEYRYEINKKAFDKIESYKQIK